MGVDVRTPGGISLTDYKRRPKLANPRCETALAGVVDAADVRWQLRVHV
jgi:hypothetical protein